MPHPLDNDSSRSAGLLLARLPMGTFFLLAGLSKIHGGIDKFVRFATPFLPAQLPHILGDTYLHMVPFLEIVVGAALALGLCSRLSAFVGMLMVISFTIAVTGASDPNTRNISPNLIYIGLTALLFFAGSGRISLDNWIWGKPAGAPSGGGGGKHK